MKLALVGLGYWGPNLLRVFNTLGVLAAAFDKDVNKLKKFATNPVYRGVHFDTEWEHCLGRNDVDGVVIATPPNTHHMIATKAIAAGKHVFVEKPMTLSVKESEEIVALANEHNRVVMVGHIFLYSPEIIKLKEIVQSDDFGDIHYAYIQRLNLGQIQAPANVVEDLAPHDISILNYLFNSECSEVLTIASSHVIDSEDVAFVSMKYKNGVMAHLHLSWLDPLKVRKTVIVGSKQMVVCDSGSKQIEVYNKGVDIEERSQLSNLSYDRHLMSYRYGDIVIPYIDNAEPMMLECKEFIDCIENNKTPLADEVLGLEVVKTLEAMQRSLKEGQQWVKV